MSAGRKIMLGTAGHVDHGKTSLVKLLTGCDTDRLGEEKRRGLTIELGYAPCRLADERIAGIIDAPGHVDFIRNMVAGAHAVDLAIICIAADDGIMPQTREHIDVMSLMGVSRGVIALTRSDLVDATRIAEVSQQVSELLKPTTLANSPIVPMSNKTGDGFDTLLQTILAEASKCLPRRPMGNFRMWIDRVFSVEGFGTVITGIPTTASVSIGEKLSLAGDKRQWRVRKLQAYGLDVERAVSGQCAAINLADSDPEDFTRGQLITASPEAKLHTMFEAAIELLGSAEEIEDYARVHLHIGSAHTTGAVALLEGEPIAPGGSGLVQLRLDSPIAATSAERFVLRAQQSGRPLTTIAGGIVLDCSDIRLKRRRPWTLEKLNRRRQSISEPHRWLRTILDEQEKPATPEALAKISGMNNAEIDEILPAITEAGKAMTLTDGSVISPTSMDAACERLRQAIQYHSEKFSAGITTVKLCSELDITPVFCGILCEKLISSNRISASTDTSGRQIFLTAVSKPASISGTDNDVDRLEDLLIKAHLEPPLPQDMAAELGITEADLEKALVKLAAAGRAVRLDRKVILHINAIEDAKQAALKIFRQQNFFETAQYRDALGISRKYAIAILDWLDTQRFTTRNAHLRRPGAAAKKLLDNG